MSHKLTRYFNVETRKAVPKDAVVLDLKQIFAHMNGGDWHDVEFAAESLTRGGGIFQKKIAEALLEQTPKPRIPEPGLWGIVEAGPKGNRTHWVKTPGDWVVVVGSRCSTWEGLEDPKLVRPGVDK